jgi:hypothetical protein
VGLGRLGEFIYMASIRDIIVIAANILVPVALFLAWIIAEFRCRTWIRIVLAFVCMFFLCFEIWLVNTTADLQIQKHRFILQHIEIMLQKNKEGQVLNALRIYNKVYQENKSTKDAVRKMDSILEDYENGELNSIK